MSIKLETLSIRRELPVHVTEEEEEESFLTFLVENFISPTSKAVLISGFLGILLYTVYLNSYIIE